LDEVCLWDRLSGKIKTLYKHEEFIRGSAATPSLRYVASVDNDSVVNVYDTVTDTVVFTKEDKGKSFSKYDVSLSDDGKFMGHMLGGTMVKIWNLETGEVMQTHSNDTMIRDIAMSPDGMMVAFGDLAGNLYVLRRDNEEPMLITSAVDGYAEDFQYIDWTPDSQNVVLASDTFLLLFDIEKKKELARVEGAAVIDNVYCRDDYQSILIGSKKGFVQEVPLAGVTVLEYGNVHRSHRSVKAQQQSDSEAALAVLGAVGQNIQGESGVSEIVNIDTLVYPDVVISEAQKHASPIGLLGKADGAEAVSANGRFIGYRNYSVGDSEGYLRIWDAVENKEVLAGRRLYTYDQLLISNDGSYIVISDQQLFVGDVSSGQDRALSIPVYSGLLDVKWSDDGQSIVCASFFGQGMVWDIRTDSPIYMHEKEMDMNAIAYESSSDLVVHSDRDGGVFVHLFESDMRLGTYSHANVMN
ncbi:MAG: WD40 repeat domain-containing protein, partial [Bacteroides sp.]|nr:WD40 repeat domain-containing protein [Bacteroides sp.]